MIRKNSCYTFPIAMFLFSMGWSSITEGANDPNSIQFAVQKAIEDLRNNGKAIPNIIIEKYGAEVIPVVEKYLQDQDRKVRMGAYRMIWMAGTQSNDNLVRQNVVKKLLSYGLKDSDWKDNISGRLLSLFKAEDYSVNAKQLLHAELAVAPEYKTILLVGAADMKSELLFFEEIIQKTEEKFPRSDNPADLMDKEYLGFSQLAFAALCARARMGIQEDVQRCIEMVEAIPRKDLKIAVMFRQLPYIRQPQVVEYLVTYLYSDKIDSGNSENPTPYAVYALNALAEMIRDFPKEKDNEGKNFETRQKQIEYNREWLKINKYNIIR